MKETKKRALPFFGIDCLLIGKKKMAFLQYTISIVNALTFLGIQGDARETISSRRSLLELLYCVGD